MVGLTSDKKRILKEYSKGMRQRIGLAQALINDPELVILDEPTSGLDPLGTRWMKDLIVDLRNQGKTVIMCSHRLEDVQDVCDRIAILNEGELQKLGSVETCWKTCSGWNCGPAACSSTTTCSATWKRCWRKHGGKLEFIGHPTTTLEDLFLRIVEESKAIRAGAICRKPKAKPAPPPDREPVARGRHEYQEVVVSPQRSRVFTRGTPARSWYSRAIAFDRMPLQWERASRGAWHLGAESPAAVAAVGIGYRRVLA